MIAQVKSHSIRVVVTQDNFAVGRAAGDHVGLSLA